MKDEQDATKDDGQEPASDDWKDKWLYPIVWAAFKLIAFFASFIAAQLLVTLTWVIIAGIDNYPASVEHTETALQMIGSVVFLFFLSRFHKKRKLSFADCAGLVQNRFTVIGTKKTKLPLFAAYGIALNLLVTALLSALPSSWVLGYNESVLDQLSKDNFIITCISVLIYGPIFEELVFRGFAFRYLKACVNPWIAAGILSVFFGVSHLQPLWSLYAAGMGMAFSWLVMQTGSVIPSIVTHATFNLVSLCVVVLDPGQVWISSLPKVAIWLVLIGFAALAAFLTLVLKRITQEEVTVADG
jgi:membrane protease YdiL (CAAX protease family)